MNIHGSDKCSFPRSFGCAAVRLVDAPFGSHVEVVERKLDGTERRLAFKAEELDALINALRDCRRLLLGDPKHAPKGVDPVLMGGERK